MSNGSRRALCIGVSSFTPAGAADEDEPDLAAFGNLDYAAEYTAGLATALRTAGYDVDLVVDSGVLKARDLGERVENHLSDDGVAVAAYINRLLELLPGYRTAAHRAGRHGFAEGVAGALVPDPGQ